MNLKKISLILTCVISVNSLSAQDLTSSHGEPILPQAKDWSIGLDATKLINASSFDFAGGLQSIMGKYFIDNKTAHRVGVRIGVNNWTSKTPTIDRVASTSSVIAYPSAIATKDNIWRRTNTVIGLTYGKEKRRGSTRLQGVYGAEGGIYITSRVDRFTYGNKLNPVSTTAQVLVDTAGDAMSSPLFGKAGNVISNPSIQGVQGAARLTEVKSGLAISLGARVFIGAEFFILPKLSLGGEFGWGFGYAFASRAKYTLESVGQANIPNVTSQVEVKKTTIDGSQNSFWWFDNDNANLIGGPSATLRLNLYF